MATFGYISVLVSHFGYKLYGHIKEMKKVHEHLPGLHLAQITIEAPSRINVTNYELLGLALILGFSALHAITLMMEEP